MGFPQLTEEDFKRIDTALNDLIAKSEASAVMLVEKAGHLIHQCGQQDQFPPDVLATLAANSFNAVQFMAGLLQENNFPGMYQQGERCSTLMMNVEENCMLVVIFSSQVSVGVVRFYANETIKTIADQIQIAEKRDPAAIFDLTDLNVTDVQSLFLRKEQEAPPAVAAEAVPPPPAELADAVPAPPAEPDAAAAAETPLASLPPGAEPEPAPAAPAEPAAPEIAKRGPFVESVFPGTYWWCACGRSKTQPFCDGAHKGTGLGPLKVEVDTVKRIAWCGCKHTQNPPFCDGGHSKLPH